MGCIYSMGGRGKDHWDTGQVNFYKAKKKQQAKHPNSLVESCSQMSLREWLTFRPWPMCRPLARELQADCRNEVRDGARGRGSHLAFCISLLFGYFFLWPLVFNVFFWDMMSSYLGNINWKLWLLQFFILIDRRPSKANLIEVFLRHDCIIFHLMDALYPRKQSAAYRCLFLASHHFY